jgi:transposase
MRVTPFLPFSPSQTSSCLELRVGVDVGSHRHAVAVGLSDGRFLEDFEIDHDQKGFRTLFSRIEAAARVHGCSIAIAMEGYNGHARPLDRQVLARGWRLFNVNNLKLARFKEIFPAAAKTDRLDARKALELFQIGDHLPLARQVLQEVIAPPEENEILKRQSRRRRRLVKERVAIVNAMQADIKSICPELLDITGDVQNLWFLRFLTCRDHITRLARLRRSSLLKVPGIGVKYAALIEEWQQLASFSRDAEWVGPMIQEDATRIVALNRQIDALTNSLETIAANSAMARHIRSIPGFGPVCTGELTGEIGTIKRFGSEGGLAFYLGMASLDRSSGKMNGSKPPKHVNKRAKAAMMTAIDRHRKSVPQSQRYYEKKRAEGKTHNQAVRALGRHLCRVIFKMLRDERDYVVSP